MLLILDDASVEHGVSEPLRHAVGRILAAMELGQHRLLVSPIAYDAFIGLDPLPGYLDALAAAKAKWVEAQAVARSVSRVIVLSEDEQRIGVVDGSRYFVHPSDVIAQGILKEPSLVMENMRVDTRFLKLCMLNVLELTKYELSRYWNARAEQGGGSTLSDYIIRHVQENIPTSLIADRDSDGDIRTGSTAAACVNELVRRGMFPDRATAIAGGFSSNSPSLSFHIIAGYSIENLVLPHVMALFFENCSTGEEDKLRSIVHHFPNFPDLSSEESLSWLSHNFKKSGPGGTVNAFDSRCIERLMDWVDASEVNLSRFDEAMRLSAQERVFSEAISAAVRDCWALGQRWYSLA